MWIPIAVRYKIPIDEFYSMCPRDIGKRKAFYDQRLKYEYETKATEMSEFAWLSGVYVLKAISACFSKNGKYPKQPYGSKPSKYQAQEMGTDGEQEEMRESIPLTERRPMDADNFAAFALTWNKQKFNVASLDSDTIEAVMELSNGDESPEE